MNEHDDEHGNIEKRLNNLEKQLKTLEMTEASGPPVGTVNFDRLSDEMQDIISKLQVEVHELQFESKIYRWVAC